MTLLRLSQQAFSERLREALVRWLVVLSLPTFALCCATDSQSRAAAMIVGSESGHFTLRIAEKEHLEHLNRMHGLTLSLTGADGIPVTNATVILTGWRRYSSTPLPTAPQVAPESEPGRYRVKGLRFHMPGEWRLVFDVTFQQIRDRATLDLVVK